MRSTLSQAELELRLVYAIVVAGKSARFANDVILRLFPEAARTAPFEYIRELLEDPPILGLRLRAARTGKYTVLENALRWLTSCNLDLAAVTPEQLAACPGVGPKTGRFFVVWTRPEERHAVLDVHVLRWLRSQGYDTPTATPSGSRYAALEGAFLKEADDRGLTPRELDSLIWDAAATTYNSTSG